jgi:hypothetical protein
MYFCLLASNLRTSKNLCCITKNRHIFLRIVLNLAKHVPLVLEFLQCRSHPWNVYSIFLFHKNLNFTICTVTFLCSKVNWKQLLSKQMCTCENNYYLHLYKDLNSIFPIFPIFPLLNFCFLGGKDICLESLKES